MDQRNLDVDLRRAWECSFGSWSIPTIAAFTGTRLDLQENLVGVAFYDFQTPLTEWQLAPPGFLAVERLMILLPSAVCTRGQAGSVSLLDRFDVS